VATILIIFFRDPYIYFYQECVPGHWK